MKYFLVLVSLAASLFAFNANAFYFRSYQTNDGLSHNCVWAVMQDSRGFLWFGTNDGLNRFDGKEFRIFRTVKGDSLSIGNNFIHCLKEDSRGRILVGTKLGLYSYNPNTETFHHIQLNPPGKADASINAIMEDSNGNIYLAGHGYGLYILSADLKVKNHFLSDGKQGSLPVNFIWSIASDYTGNVWIGTIGHGLVRYDPKLRRFFSDPAFADIRNGTVYSVYCDIDNTLWIGTATNGLLRYSPSAGTVTRYLPNVFNIKSIIEYSDHELIMGADKGLVKFDRTTRQQELLNSDYSFDNMTDNSIFSIARDKEGSFWIGTYFGGVNYFSPAINRFHYFYNTPQNSNRKNIVSHFAENSDGKIWMGTHNDGLYLFDPANDSFSKPFSLGHNDIQSILFYQDRLYTSLNGIEMSILDTKTGKLTPIHMPSGTIPSCNTIYRTSKGMLLFAHENGVIAQTPDGKCEPIQQLRSTPTKDITEDYEGSIWFATHLRGLARLTADNRWEHFTNNPNDPHSLPGNNVNCVFQDANFRIWVGTEGEGLALFNPKKNNFDTMFNNESGLPSNIIYSILNDAEGNLWVSTGGGLVKISTDLKTIKNYSHIGDIHRIQYNLNCALRSSDNRLYFGGTNGFITFNPKEITDNTIRPNVLLTGLQIMGKAITPNSEESPLQVSISATKELTLSHDQSSFSFSFIALSYISPEQNKYAYRLDGYDKDWHYTSTNHVSYMNLPAGSYTFRVKGTNNDGIWGEKEASIIIHIQPSPWLSAWMIALYVILSAGAVFYAIRRYHIALTRKNQEKMFKYEAAKEKKIYESKINFFTNIAHEIRTPLSLIAAPLERIISSGDGNEQTKSNLALIKRNANRLLELINQLLDFRKVESDMFHFNFQPQNVVRIVEKCFRQYAANSKMNQLDARLEKEQESVICKVDAEAVYKIVSNLIGNAVKYAQQQITVSTRTDGQQFEVVVEDDGKGIEPQYAKKIFEPFFQIEDANSSVRMGSGLGLSLSRSLAAKHGGNITVESEYGKFCRFILQLPIAEQGTKAIDNETPPDETPSDQPSEKPTDTNAKILIVEDNADMRAFLCQNLDGYTTFEAEDGIQALELLEKEDIDVIVSDIMMPNMDGMELCDRIKGNPAYSHLPLILLSAKTDMPTKLSSLNRGADVYIEKPFSLDLLKSQISSIIENRDRIRQNFINSPLQCFKYEPKQNTEAADFVNKLNAIILENMSDEEFSIDNLSYRFAISRSNLHKKIKKITGMTPNDYIKIVRLNESARLLATGKYKINEVCFLVGFNTPSYFSKCFFAHFGKLPKDFLQSTVEQ